MTALVDRLEQLHAEATPGPWKASSVGRYERIYSNDVAIAEADGNDTALIVELRNALPALLAAVRAARGVDDLAVTIGAFLQDEELHAAATELRAALAPLFGEATTP